MTPHRSTTGILVFARLDSRRLPGKALLPLVGRPMLARVLDRVRQVAGAQTIVATSDRSVDDAIARLAESEGVGCFRGDVDDVLGRCIACARAFHLARVVRISGDSPFIDPALITEVLKLQESTGAGLATNVHPRTFPPGQSVEVLTREALEMATPDGPEDREHVTPWFYRNADRVGLANHTSPDPAWAELRLVVDDATDRARAEKLMAQLGSAPERATLARIISSLRAT